MQRIINETMTKRRDFIKQSSANVAGGILGGNMLFACRSGNPLENVPIGKAFVNPPSSARPGVFRDGIAGSGGIDELLINYS
jgi:hypothetical protein